MFSPNVHRVQDINLNLKNYFTFVFLLFLKMNLKYALKKLCQVKRNILRESLQLFPRHSFAKFQKVKSSVQRIRTSTVHRTTSEGKK